MDELESEAGVTVAAAIQVSLMRYAVHVEFMDDSNSDFALPTFLPST